MVPWARILGPATRPGQRFETRHAPCCFRCYTTVRYLPREASLCAMSCTLYIHASNSVFMMHVLVHIHGRYVVGMCRGAENGEKRDCIVLGNRRLNNLDAQLRQLGHNTCYRKRRLTGYKACCLLRSGFAIKVHKETKPNSLFGLHFLLTLCSLQIGRDHCSLVSAVSAQSGYTSSTVAVSSELKVAFSDYLPYQALFTTPKLPPSVTSQQLFHNDTTSLFFCAANVAHNKPADFSLVSHCLLDSTTYYISR
jgi:hypothetical protein